jgi:hypothetical protein
MMKKMTAAMPAGTEWRNAAMQATTAPRVDGACRKCPEVLIETAQLGPG